ncbi:MAG: molybdate ABC transporter substrate-binding protein [Pseudomonadota bacterium]|nr:molybdate ABC transporter substrate-binding protein [Pseudomonadota bacterium]
MFLWLLIVSAMIPNGVCADETTLRVAVASNFRTAIEVLADQFRRETGYKVDLVFGSTGKHYAQILNGAPFDVFFAADTERPRLLVEQGAALPDTRSTYALGRLVLWSPIPGYVDRDGAVLGKGDFRHLAIANPKLAPYGRAAEEVLRRGGHWEALRNRMVRGENISQTFQYVGSGNAELGFVAYSQVKRRDGPVSGSCWDVPESSYSPIEQQVVLLRESAAGRALLSFIGGRSAARIIRNAGYGLPEDAEDRDAD